jgi:hypothetical protein
MKRSATGERLWREFRVRVVIPGTKDIVWRLHPPAKRGYSAADLDKMLDQVAEYLEKRFPSIEFRMVELAPNVCNFIYAGRKAGTGNANRGAAQVHAGIHASLVIATEELRQAPSPLLLYTE